LWEPDDGRLSRPVLREPGGEIPPGYLLQKLTGKGSLAFRDRPFSVASRHITKLAAELKPSSMISAETGADVVTEVCR
jgi:hypothetical protein